MSAVGLNSKDDFSEAKPVIHEDPNSNAHLEALFDVLNEPSPPVKEGKTFPEAIPMTKRKFPDSFFNPSKDRAGMRRLGPSISVGASGMAAHHNRSVSMPASINDAHPRQYPLDNNVQGPIPPGWEEAQTPDGLSYFIDHNNKTTTWEDPRKAMSRISGRAPVPSHLPMPYQQGSMHPALPPHNSGSNQSIDSIPLPEGWQKAFTAEGEAYYVNHKNRTTSWFHPSLPQHNHSHSFAGVQRSIGQQMFPGYTHHHGGMGAVQQGRIPYDANRQHDPLLQQQPNLMEVNRAPGLYNDPYLSSNNHIRQASHDSGLGVTNVQFQSEMNMDYEDGMDTGHSSIKVPLNPEYLESMPATDIDSEGLQPDQQMQDQMEGDLIGRWV